MITSGDYILGNSDLHQRVRVITDVLGKFVSSAPRTVSIAQLHEHTGIPLKQLTKLCGSLWRATLVRPRPGAPGEWELACPASAITLEDVFRCVILEQGAGVKAPKLTLPEGDSNGVARDVDLLVMQATMSVNQSVFQHLRKFSLDRLKFGDSAADSPGKSNARRTFGDEAAAWQYPPLPCL